MIAEDLKEFAKKGAAAQMAADKLLALLRKCPYCGKDFLPQAHNQKFCSYTCRNHDRYERRKQKEQNDKRRKTDRS